MSSSSSAVACPGCGSYNSAFNPCCSRCGAPLPAESSAARTTDLSASGAVPETRVDAGEAPISTVDPLASTVHEADSGGPGGTIGDVPVAARELGPGARLGRFEVVERVGRGAMGLVVRARDPVLGREVAIKVLRPEALGRAGAGRAQAMARIKHPNVVTVHEVDASGGEVLVVMEYVEGRTLRAFTVEARRPAAEIVRVFAEAGRGLAEVHRAGLVHRDFKPDNVLVGADGRVRVTDFGPVGLAGGEDGEGEVEAGEGDSGVALTRSGALLGTPAYMAPEQHARGAVDARADPFAFCVALWEALTGERPFAGEAYAALREAVTRGELRQPPREARLSARLRRVLARGLSVDPDARYPSMDALLVELTRDPATAWRRALAVGLVALASAGAALALRHA